MIGRGILMTFAALLLLAALDPVMFGPGSRFQLERSEDDFGMRSHGGPRQSEEPRFVAVQVLRTLHCNLLDGVGTAIPWRKARW